MGFSSRQVEGEEEEKQTAQREIKEETGLDVKLVEGFRKTTNWFYRWEGQDIFKEAVYFLAETTQKEVKISHEHVGYLWLEYEATMKTLTYVNTKEILKAAHKFLKGK